MKNFALTGLGGYIAPRHLEAIKETGNKLVAAVDLHDSVGVIDSYFPEASFFTEIERFDRHLEKCKRTNTGESIDYLTVCSPNHLHDAHIRLAMRVGADAICEKPLVLNPWNLDILEKLEIEYRQRVWTVLQLRVHPTIINLKKNIVNVSTSKRYKVRLTYVTMRGLWYNFSWKGNPEMSGGIGTNIGIHFFDMLIWLFGPVQKSELHLREPNRMGGFLELATADVEWFLSLEAEDLPLNNGNLKRTHREIIIDEETIEFSGGFNNLHTSVYSETLFGRGFGIEDARPSIELVYGLRTDRIIKNSDNPIHPRVRDRSNNLYQ